MHAGFRTQEAERVVAFDLDGGGFDAGDFAFGFFEQLGLETFAFGVAQVLTQQHGGPVLSLGATSTRLNVKKAVHRIGRIREHPTKLHAFQQALEPIRIGFDGFKGGVVAIVGGHLKQFTRIGDGLRQRRQRHDDVFDALFFAPKILGVFRVVPDFGVFKFGIDNVQALGFYLVVKDTPGEPTRAWRSRRGGTISGSGVRLPFGYVR